MEVCNTINLAGRDSCTGCSACYSVCPSKCIKMEEDDEGFYFPTIGQKCISCGACQRVCPIVNPLIKPNSFEQQACCAIHKDDSVWKKSSSGGAFSAICEIFGDEDSFVFGAVFSSQNKGVIHTHKKGVANLTEFLGSKYVQSNIGDAFVVAKHFLDEGKRVIFSGTPCQIAGLNGFLKGVEYENLLTIDLACHGVGSPGVFKKHLEHLSEQNRSNVKKYTFRNKSTALGIHRLYGVCVEYDSGKKQNISDDVYSQMFFEKTICRRSCFGCPYMSLERNADISLADYKNMYAYIPEASAMKNGSAVLCNTEKGYSVFSRLPEKMYVYPCTVKSAANNNSFYFSFKQGMEKRNRFFSDYKNSSSDYFLEKYRVKKSMLTQIKHLIPEKIKGRLKRCLIRKEK